jgi:adenylate cyclase
MTQDTFTRRLTAILIADVAGYSRLMGEDETATVRILEKYKGIIGEFIGRHRGRVADSAGDNLLAMFASVGDAAECAVRVQKELKVQNDELPLNRRMKFRIGINFGDVIEEGSRIYGDSVNLAARIESLAEPGGVCLSKAAFDQIRTKLPYGYAFLGEHGMGNIASPVKVYKVLLESRATGHKTAGLRPRGTMWRLALIGTAAALLVAGGVELWRFRPWPAAPAVEKANPQQMAPPLEIIQKLRDTNRRISNLPSDLFKNAGMKTALANRLSAAMRDISNARYPEAMRTLDHDVLQRMDGCAQTRKPDRNDWMMTCSAQENAYFLVTEAIDMLDELM